MTSKNDEEHEANVDRVQAFLMGIIDEATANRAFAARLASALAGSTADPAAKQHRAPPSRRSQRRQPGAVDPFDLYDRGGEVLLRDELTRYDCEQLKDIIAEHGMDRTKLAMRWRSADRLIGLIVETVDARTRKGDAFRLPTAPSTEESPGGTGDPTSRAPDPQAE